MEYEIPNGIRYRTPDAERVYRAPQQPAPFQAPPVTAGAVKVEGTVLAQSHAQILNARDAFQKHLDETNAHAEHYTPEGLQHQIAAFQNTDAAKAVDTAEQQVVARRDQAQTQLDKVYKSLSPNGDAAAESRATRLWNRTERLLDSLDNSAKFGAAQDIIKQASREELGTLLQELPAYLKSCGVTTDWIDTVVGQTVPEYSNAKAQLQKADAAVMFVRQNANSLRRAFADGRTNGVVIVDPFAPDKYGKRSKYDPDA
jgi:hypothetical protein